MGYAATKAEVGKVDRVWNQLNVSTAVGETVQLRSANSRIYRAVSTLVEFGDDRILLLTSVKFGSNGKTGSVRDAASTTLKPTTLKARRSRKSGRADKPPVPAESTTAPKPVPAEPTSVAKPLGPTKPPMRRIPEASAPLPDLVRLRVSSPQKTTGQAMTIDENQTTGVLDTMVAHEVLDTDCAIAEAQTELAVAAAQKELQRAEDLEKPLSRKERRALQETRAPGLSRSERRKKRELEQRKESRTDLVDPKASPDTLKERWNAARLGDTCYVGSTPSAGASVRREVGALCILEV